jgi:hypothetical protein
MYLIIIDVKRIYLTVTWKPDVSHLPYVKIVTPFNHSIYQEDFLLSLRIRLSTYYQQVMYDIGAAAGNRGSPGSRGPRTLRATTD